MNLDPLSVLIGILAAYAVPTIGLVVWMVVVNVAERRGRRGRRANRSQA